MQTNVAHFCRLLACLCLSLWIHAEDEAGTPVGEWLGFSPEERFQLVRLLTPEDPDGFVVRQMVPFKVLPLFALRETEESLRESQRGTSRDWAGLACNYALLRAYEDALRTLRESDPSGEDHFSQRLLEAWLLDRTGKHAESRALYEVLGEEEEYVANILRLRICQELRLRRFQAAADLMAVLLLEDDNPAPPSSEFLRGLVAYAIRDDYRAFEQWKALNDRLAPERLAGGMLGMACLNYSTGGTESAIGWMARGLAMAVPSDLYAWLHSPLSEKLSQHPGYAAQIRSYPVPDTKPGPSGDSVFLDYMDVFQELQNPDVRLRLKLFQKDTEYRTLQLLNIDDL